MILLGRKKYGGAKGILNGFGGKVEKADNSVTDAIMREFWEETSAKLIDPKLVATVYFKHEGKSSVKVYVYKCYKWQGLPKTSEEMSVRWYSMDDIPIDQMWPSDSLWFPIVLKHDNVKIILDFGSEKTWPINMKINFYDL